MGAKEPRQTNRWLALLASELLPNPWIGVSRDLLVTYHYMGLDRDAGKGRTFGPVRRPCPWQG